MGAGLSCDVCNKALSEETDDVHECKDATLEHVCVTCFDSEAHKGYVKRSVYGVIGEENVRRINQQNGPGAQAVADALAGSFSDCIKCECGAGTVPGKDVVSCFSCGKMF